MPEPSTGDACIDGVQQGVDGGNGEEGMHPDIAAPNDVIHEGAEVDDATTGNDVETSQRPDNIFKRLQAAGFPVPNVISKSTPLSTRNYLSPTISPMLKLWRL